MERFALHPRAPSFIKFQNCHIEIQAPAQGASKCDDKGIDFSRQHFASLRVLVEMTILRLICGERDCEREAFAISLPKSPPTNLSPRRSLRLRGLSLNMYFNTLQILVISSKARYLFVSAESWCEPIRISDQKGDAWKGIPESLRPYQKTGKHHHRSEALFPRKICGEN